MAARNKVGQMRAWRKWYQSGAVQQPALPIGGLVIDGIGTHIIGPAADNSTLSLSYPEDYAGNSSYSPVMYVIVSSGNKVRLGGVLRRLPGNAVPMDLFFP